MIESSIFEADSYAKNYSAQVLKAETIQIECMRALSFLINSPNRKASSLLKVSIVCFFPTLTLGVLSTILTLIGLKNQKNPFFLLQCFKNFFMVRMTSWFLFFLEFRPKKENFKYSQQTELMFLEEVKKMPSAKLDSSKDAFIMPMLAKELEKEIPDLDIYGLERKLLDFAYNDLEISLNEKLITANFIDIKEALNDETCREEIKVFLKIWTKKWLGKWRERVTFCQKVPPFSLEHLKIKKKAAKIFNQIENNQELKKMVMQRLVTHGEICMPELIAKNLIIEEIAFRLKINGKKKPKDKGLLDPWSIFQEVSPRVKSLSERKTPIIHLKLMTDS